MSNMETDLPISHRAPSCFPSIVFLIITITCSCCSLHVGPLSLQSQILTQVLLKLWEHSKLAESEMVLGDFLCLFWHHVLRVKTAP